MEVLVNWNWAKFPSLKRHICPNYVLDQSSFGQMRNERGSVLAKVNRRVRAPAALLS